MYLSQHINALIHTPLHPSSNLSLPCRLMPTKREAWGSWNYIGTTGEVCRYLIYLICARDVDIHILY